MYASVCSYNINPIKSISNRQNKIELNSCYANTYICTVIYACVVACAFIALALFHIRPAVEFDNGIDNCSKSKELQADRFLHMDMCHTHAPAYIYVCVCM